MSMPDIELAHEVEDTPHHRRLAFLVGLAAIVTALLGVLQMQASTREGSNSARASRLTAELARGLEIFGLVTAFEGPTKQEVLADTIAAHSRAITALNANAGVGFATAAADAEGAATDRLNVIIDEMVETPTAQDGVDPLTRETMERDLNDLIALQKEQGAAVDLTARYSQRSDRAVLALSIIAVAAVLLGLAGIVGPVRAGTAILIASAVAILASVATGASALLI